MIQKHRISTNIGEDQRVTVELKQDYDLLEILSLKFSQKDAYTSLCADYGVVCGRISVNNGFGIPNARVSIFVPLSEKDSQDPVISALYPYKSISDKDQTNHRYNLLPARKQHGGHEPTGTFPDQTDILTREEVLEVYEKYYTYTVKTNSAGDFMIWGVPLGEQIIHVDVDLSDIGCFSLRPDDFIRLGEGLDKFKNSYQFKASEDLDSLPQIVSFEQTINVYPFWGNQDLCEIGISRTDFDLSSRGVNIQPKAYFLGSVYSDQGDNAVNKNCTPGGKMGRKCDLITGPAVVEVIRFTNNLDSDNRPILESYELNEDVDEDGSFVLSLPMNLEYVYTNEFGDIEVTNDPNKGIPTTGVYRFRVSMKNESLGRVRTVGSYLAPNIREFRNNDGSINEKSYNWSLKWEDYPSEAVNDSIIFNNTLGSFYPKDYFYRMNYNKVYSLSSFMGSYFSSNGISRHTYLGIKDISPKAEEDCESNVVTPPVNWGIQKFNFAILLAIIVNVFERILYYAFVSIVQVLIIPFQFLMDNVKFNIRAFGGCLLCWEPFAFFDSLVIEPLQRFGTVRLGISIYPECETCDNLDFSNESVSTTTDPAMLYNSVMTGQVAFPVSFVASCFSGLDSKAMIFKTPSYGQGNYSCAVNNNPNVSLLNTISSDLSNRYIVKSTNTGNYTNLSLTKTQLNGFDYYYFLDTQSIFGSSPTGPQSYTIYDSQSSLVSSGGSQSSLNSELEGGCQQYVTAYDETMITKSYCVTNPNTPYNSLTTTMLQNGTSCSGGKILAGQQIGNDTNPCGTCSTKSGFSEFRYGLFTIIPAAKTNNWTSNFKAIGEYARRKLVGKLFCEGIVNYSYLDNWLTGSLYLFPFKAKVRWDDEEKLDLNYARTKYCENLVYFKVSDKRFYYRSSYTPDGGNFFRAYGTLGHPTTIVDLGPRDEFIKEICTDPSMDPNCSVARSIGPSSYQDFKEFLGLYINYKMDTLGANGDYTDFFDNNGFDSVMPNKMDGYVFNGDALQLISINCEAGIEQFDLQNRKYAVYNPRVIDAELLDSIYSSNAFPLNLYLDGTSVISGRTTDGDGYRVRSCLNEFGRLTEAAQEVPFYLWDKNGTGFGNGTDHHWDYGNVSVKPLQGMEYNYSFTGDSSHKYILFPMTEDSNGTGVTISSITLSEPIYDRIDDSDNHTDFNNQEEGYTYLFANDVNNPSTGTLYTRVGSAGNWISRSWNSDIDYIIKPTATNYTGNKQILSTPFQFYFGLRPGKTAVDKFMQRFGPKGAFKTAE
jgi:hypothetical protein